MNTDTNNISSLPLTIIVKYIEINYNLSLPNLPILCCLESIARPIPD